MKITPASILVIERHPMMHEALCTAISEEPDMKVAKPVHSRSGLEEVALLGSWETEALACNPDIILLALGNPGLRELEILKTLHKSLPGIPILILTGDEVPGQEQAARQAGASAVVSKAMQRSELIHELRELSIAGGKHR
jgi:DNA-binding NarL/FixJ family response regulator